MQATSADFGVSRAGQQVSVFLAGTMAPATVYDSNNQATNTLAVAQNGKVYFRADPGSYDLHTADLTRTVVLSADDIPSGIELYYGEVTSDETTTQSLGTPEPLLAADLTFTLAAQVRPVYVTLQCGVSSNSAAGPGAALHIGGASNATLYARSTVQLGTAASTGPLVVFKRFPPGFTGVIRAYKSRIGATGTATLFGSFHPISLRVVTA